MSRTYLTHVLCATLFVAAVFAATISRAVAETPAPLATITVETGARDRNNVPVSVTLPDTINARQPLQLVEGEGDKRKAVPCQVASGNPRQLWWILDGKTPAGKSRVYKLSYGTPIKDGVIKIDLNSKTLDVNFADARLFSYNHAHVEPPKGVKKEYIRSGYITPLFSPGGKLITEDFPGDHYHHKGIWFPWTHTKFEGKTIDFWNLGKRQGTVQHAGFEVIENGPIFGRFKARHEFVDLTQPNGGKVAVNEVWDVRVWAVGGPKAGTWLFDITSTQRCASDSPLLLLKYRYGGMAYRGPKEWKDDNYKVLTSEGKTKKDGHATRGKWCAHSGSIDKQPTTVVVLCSPKNERFPEPMRIWPGGGCFFNFVPIQKEDMTLEPGKTYTFSYRFYVHEGEIDREKAEGAWRDFAEPPLATLVTQ